MSLRRKLIYLHSAFAAFAVITASVTIYGVQLYVHAAITKFEQIIDQSNLVDQLRVAAGSQLNGLHEVIDGRREVNAAFLARRDAFFTRLEEVASFAIERDDESSWRSLQALGRSIKSQSDTCITLAQVERRKEAHDLLDSKLENDLLVALDDRLHGIRRSLDDARRRSVDRVLTTNTQLLGVAGLIAIGCAGLVVAGASLVRRWLIGPVTHLEAATHEFAKGNLAHRVELGSGDELDSLGSALNTMAFSLAESETKYRALFENLRDAVIICDSDGAVVECQDGDTEILGVDPAEAIGRRLGDIWPEWLSDRWDWKLAVSRVTGAGERVRAVDVEMAGNPGARAFADVIAYPVEYAGTRYAAILFRDVTERHDLQQLLRRSETMEATVTFARGIAHDFKNLLHSAVTTLSLIEKDTDGSKSAERIETALRACGQAASLSRRLLAFATNDEGTPEVFDLNEMVELILGSLDEPFLAPLQVHADCHRTVLVRVDRDHLTQVILNLIRNARDAMPDGGTLRITTDSTVTANPLRPGAAARYAVLTVLDTGCGMTAEVKERLFEPLFSTKARGPEGARGMGLAVVYAAVRNAGGFIQLESEADAGTTFRVYLPSGEGAPEAVLPRPVDRTRTAEGKP